MLRMLNRRVFGKLAASAAVVLTSETGRLMGQASSGNASSGQGLKDSQFSVMIWALNKRGTFEENLEHVAKAGYHHVQLVGEFNKWSDADWTHMLGRMGELKISVDASTAVSQGFADPAGGDAFIAELKAAMPVLKRLDCKQLILVSGKRVDGAADGAQHQASIENLKRAAPILSEAGVMAVIEPIDRLENPPIYLDGVTEGFEITRAVGSPNVKVLYDLYHEQRTHGNLIEKLEKNIDEVGLIHIADVPGRHEPGTGEIDYGNIYKKLVELKYTANIAMEFYPTGDVVETLRRAREEAMRA
jgi:hydroxypyruvate isomerase